MIEPTERMPSVSLGALDLVYRRTSIETYGHALAQVRVALNDFADLLA